MLEYIDTDPLTGAHEYVEWLDGGRQFRIHTIEDQVERYTDFAKALANEGTTDKGLKGEMWLYAIIPPVVQARFFARGINLLDKNDAKKVVSTINSDYPWLKTTSKHHALRR
jgi:hypothetical protein